MECGKFYMTMQLKRLHACPQLEFRQVVDCEALLEAHQGGRRANLVILPRNKKRRNTAVLKLKRLLYLLMEL